MDILGSQAVPIPRKRDYGALAPVSASDASVFLHGRAASAPAPNPISGSSSPAIEEIVSTSPAAQFFAGFYSPPPSIASLAELDPDAEGNVVYGFTLGKTIGIGGFSVIKEAVSATTGSLVAIKIVRSPSAEARHAVEQEEAIWSRLSHEHILPLFSAHSTPRATYFVTLLCPAGSLFDILRTNAPGQDDAGTMFRQVVRGLRYLHERARIVHGDMKLENVLVDECGACKIADFGLARALDDESDASASGGSSDDDGPPRRRATVPAGLANHLSLRRPNGNSRFEDAPPRRAPRVDLRPGSLPYAAPELLLPRLRRKKSGTTRANPAQDVWALGVMLYALLTGGRFPFADAFDARMRQKILLGRYEVPASIGAAAQVLAGCLNTELRARWDVRMVDEAAWSVGWGDVEDDARHSRSRSARRAEAGTSTSESRSRSRVGPIRTSRSRDTALSPVASERRGRPRVKTDGADSRSRSRSQSGPMTPVDAPYAFEYATTLSSLRELDIDDDARWRAGKPPA